MQTVWPDVLMLELIQFLGLLDSPLLLEDVCEESVGRSA